jgi:site-specific recombinase XerD
MTKHFFTDPATVRRLHEGPLGAYIESYAALLASQGYARQSARGQLRVVADLSRWLQQQGLAAPDLNPQRVQDYLSSRQRSLRPHRSDAAVLGKLLDLLRAAGVSRPARPALVASPLQRVEQEFQRYLSQERGLSRATLGNYLPFVRQFLVERFGTGRIQLTKLRAAEVTDFVQRYARTLSPGSAKLLVTALRAFLRHLHLRGAIATDLAACVPGVPHWSWSTVPKFLPPGQVQRILDHCDRRTAAGQRDYAILLLLARLGLRAGEVVALTLDDIDWAGGSLMVRSKGGRWAQLPLPAEVGEALAGYLRHGRPPCASRRVFLRLRAPHGGFANSIAICSLVARALGRAGIESPRKGAHLFRHTLASEMLRHGASLAEIGQLLRHQHPNTTMLYAKVDLDALRTLALPWPGGAQ